MNLRSPRAAVYAVAALASGFAATRWGPVTRAEEPLSALLRRPLGPDVDRRIAVATDLGSVYAVVGATAILAGLGRPRRALDVAGAGLMAWTAAQAMKPLADRQRPFESHGADRLVAIPVGSAWPSGHSAVAAATAATLSEDAPAMVRRGLGGMAGFVAVSRVHVGVHHVSDVVAGWGIGVLSAAVWRLIRHPVRALLRGRGLAV